MPHTELVSDFVEKLDDFYELVDDTKWRSPSGQEPPINCLSRCHTKRRMSAHCRVHPSFGMTTTFEIYFKNK